MNRLLTLLYAGVLCVVAFIDDLRDVVVNKLSEVVAAVGPSGRSVFDRRPSGADELFEVALSRQPALLHAVHIHNVQLSVCAGRIIMGSHRYTGWANKNRTLCFSLFNKNWLMLCVE